MITYEQFAVTGAPCTGAEWFLRGCDMLELKKTAGPRDRYYTPPSKDWSGFSISFVRHPLLWLVDYFHQMQGKVIGVSLIDSFQEDLRGCRDNFNLFVESALRRHPADVSKVFETYQTTTVMKYDDQPWAAVEFWQSLVGDEHPLLKMNGTSLEVFGGWLDNREVRRDVIKHNRDFCLRYEYY